MKIKVKFILLLFTLIFALNFKVSAREKIFFNKVDTKILYKSALNSTDFIQYPARSGISIDKIWTIKFTSSVDMNKIDGILVQKDKEFVPVNITISDTDKITVKPATSYVPNSQYSLKIFLSSGKKYNLNFTTEDASRNADSGTNINYLSANTVNLGESITGNLTENENIDDWYKINIGKDCDLNLTIQQNQGKSIQVYLYGKNGDNDYHIDQSSPGKSAANLIQSVEPGTYYIKVSSYYTGSYKLDIGYAFNTDSNDDENNDVYLNAQDISSNLNSTITGHIRYADEDSNVDEADYYKVILNKEGLLNVDINHKNAENIQACLYGKTGDNEYKINQSDSWKSAGSFSSGLEAGTYYIKVTSDYSGSYELTTNFQENKEINDGLTNRVYLHATDINIGDTKTGHIGYINDSGEKNTNDWYRIILASDSTLNFNVSSNEGGSLYMYIYGKNADNDFSIDSSYGYKGVANLSHGLKAGTYYIKVYSDLPQGYKLTVTND